MSCRVLKYSYRQPRRTNHLEDTRAIKEATPLQRMLVEFQKYFGGHCTETAADEEAGAIRVRTNCPAMIPSSFEGVRILVAPA